MEAPYITWRRSPRVPGTRLLIPVLLLVIMSVVSAGTAITLAQSGTPVPAPLMLPMDAFYERPASIPDQPGTLLKREQLLDREIPANAQAWRIQYSTTLPDGSPGIAVATVLAPAERPSGPLPVITWEHGTVGILQKCMFSLARTPFAGIPALDQVVAKGWVLVATDYAVDAQGIIPYLIGEGEAHSSLDAVRAARQMPELNLADQTVVWGHSQGGQAALWTGMIGARYAPDIEILGVAALAPATDMAGILASHGGDSTGARLGAYGAVAYSHYYPDVVFEEIVSPAALDIARQMADLCQFDPVDAPTLQALTTELDGQPVVINPYAGTLGQRLEENFPGGAISAPLLIVQGLDDVVIPPSFNDDFVAKRCTAGQNLTYWRIPGRDHGGIVQPDSPLTDPLIAWTADRFDGVAAATGCTEAVLD